MMLTSDPRDLEIESLRAALDRETAIEIAAEQTLRVAAAVSRCGPNGWRFYYRHLTEYSLDLITIMEADGTIRFESRSVSRELGWNRRNYRTAAPLILCIRTTSQMSSRPSRMPSKNHGSTPLLSFRFRRKDGAYRILEGREIILVDDPAVRGILFNSRDVTDQRKLEEQFHQAQKKSRPSAS